LQLVFITDDDGDFDDDDEVMIQFLTLAIFGGRTALQTELPLE